MRSIWQPLIYATKGGSLTTLEDGDLSGEDVRDLVKYAPSMRSLTLTRVKEETAEIIGGGLHALQHLSLDWRPWGCSGWDLLRSLTQLRSFQLIGYMPPEQSLRDVVAYLAVKDTATTVTAPNGASGSSGRLAMVNGEPVADWLARYDARYIDDDNNTETTTTE